MPASDLRSLWTVRLRPPPALRQTLLSWLLPGVAVAMLLMAAAISMSSALRSSDHNAEVTAGVERLRSIVLEVAARGDAERLRALVLEVAGRESAERRTVLDENLTLVESRLLEQWTALESGIDSELGDPAGRRARELIEGDLNAFTSAVRAYAAGELDAAVAEAALERATFNIDALTETLTIAGEAKRSERRLAGFGGALWLFAAIVTGAVATWRWQRSIGWLRHRDPVTGLPNRDSFEKRTQHAIDRAPDVEFAILFMDIRRFSLINESLGQHVGDALLARIAKRLAAHLRSGDVLARFGGDQFVVMTRSGVEETIGAIQEAVDEPFEEGEHSLDISFAIGSSRYPADGDRADRLISRASTAMSRAKRGGGPAAFTHNLDSASNGRLLLESELRRATTGEQFILRYQPQFSASDLRLTGMEALIRWNHPKRGFVLPGEFIPVLEDSDLIVPVGAWILETACRQVRTWMDDGLDAVPVSVNVSARQLLRPDFLAVVAGALSAANLPPQYLEIEVTETLAIEQVDVAARVFADLRSQGMRVALDDFGQGHSSLGRLSQIPLDTLKIDRSFIEEMTESKESVSLVEGIIFLARALELDVVAEGVETEEQLELLRELNCDVVQGFLLARPLDEQAIRKLLFEESAARRDSMPANA